MKPILFNGEMVRAILDDRKTVTRRVAKQKNVDDVLNSEARTSNPDIPDYKFIKCLCNAPYEIDDILWVRETWSKDENGEYVYRANYGTTEDDSFPPSMFKWKPSIHMPREAARIFLKVTDVRVERLQNITEQQAKAEGVSGLCYDVETGEERYDMTFFKILWNSTIKKQEIDRYGWDANPFVWVIEFERTEKPND